MNGAGLGVVLATVSVYIVEIATTDMRGFLGCFVQFLGSVGVLVTFVLGAYFNWWQLALVQLAAVVPFILAMIAVPESPRWLLLRGNEWQAEVSLKWLRGRGPENLDREIEKIKKEIAFRKRERNSITMLLEPQVDIKRNNNKYVSSIPFKVIVVAVVHVILASASVSGFGDWGYKT